MRANLAQLLSAAAILASGAFAFDDIDGIAGEDVVNANTEQADTNIVTNDGLAQCKNWTEQDIKDEVASHSASRAWESLGDKELLSDASRKAWATSIVEQLVNHWENTTCKDLSNVCNSGLECRNRIFVQMINELRDSWSASLQQIDTYLKAGIVEVRGLIDGAYKEAYECDPWCTCDNIHVEYDAIRGIQDEITGQITELWSTLQELYAKEGQILENCPEYKQIDGKWYYDLEDNRALVGQVEGNYE